MKDHLITALLTFCLFVAFGFLLIAAGVVKPTKRGLEIKVPVKRIEFFEVNTNGKTLQYDTNGHAYWVPNATERKSEDVFTIYYGNVPIAQCRRCTNCGEPVVRCLDAIETSCPNHGK